MRPCTNSRLGINVRSWFRSHFILPTYAYIFGEEAKDGEKTRKSSSTTDFIQKLVSLRTTISPTFVILMYISVPRMHLNEAVNYAIEVLVLI